MNYLSHQRVKEQYLEDSKYIFCKLDNKRELSADAERFICMVNRGLSPDRAGGDDHYNSLRKTVESLHCQGYRMVLLLDDFHLVTGNSNFPLEFFSYLRSLANNYNLAYVTTSFLELQKLCVIKDIEESPFFNIFTNLSLGPLCRGEGIRLLAAVTGREQEMVKRVAEWCGTSPNLLKLIGRKIADTKGLSDLSNLNCEEVLLPAISPYFEQILSILPREAYKPLKSIARHKQPDPREAHHLRALLKQGFLIEENDGITCFSPALAAFLKKYLAPKMLLGRV